MRAMQVDREPLRRYDHSKLSKMAAAAISNLFESKIAPLDRTTGCGDIATWNFSNMAVAAILDLFEP